MLCNVFRTKFGNKFVTKNGPVLPPCKFFLDHRVDDQILNVEGFLWPGGHTYCGSVYDSPGIAVAAVVAVVNNTGRKIKVIIMTLRSWGYLIGISVFIAAVAAVVNNTGRNIKVIIMTGISVFVTMIQVVIRKIEFQLILFHVLKHVNLYVS